MRVLMRAVRHDRRHREVLGRRRRGNLPFESLGTPRIGGRPLTLEDGPREVDHRQHVSDREDRGAERRGHVEHLELVGVDVVATGHAEIAEDELGEERQVEADEHHQRGELRPRLRIHPAADLRPPVVHAAEVAHDRAADHDVVEMRDDEVGVVHVDVEAHRREEQPGEAADREQAEEPERIQHRRVEADRPFVDRRRPVEHLDRRRHRDDETQDREEHPGVHRLAGDEDVMAPDEEPDHRDRERRKRDERVAEDVLAREGLDDLADHAHRRQDHDVDRRVRVEPEQVLEQDRVAAERRIEDAHVEEAFGRDEEHGDRDHRRAQDHDQAGRVQRPHEERQPEPGQPRRPHPVHGDDEVQSGQDRREPGDEDAERGGDDVAVRRRRAVWRVERPARVDSAAERRNQREEPAEHIDVPAQEVDPREGEVLRPDHDRDEEIAEHGRDRRDQEEEHHHDAVHGEELVVRVGRHQVARRRQQLEPDDEREHAAEEEEGGDRREVQQRDPFMVLRQQPGCGAVAVVQVIQGFHDVPRVARALRPVAGAELDDALQISLARLPRRPVAALRHRR